MANRFTDTEKWRDKWFRALSPNAKLIFIYLVDSCDMAGFIEVDHELISFCTGIGSEDMIEGMKELDGKVELSGDWAWVVNFLHHQRNLPLNPQNNAHRNIIKQIEKHKDRFSNSQKLRALIGANEGLNSPIGKGRGNGKENKEGVGATMEEIEQYARKRAVEKGYDQDFVVNIAEQFYLYYSGRDWCDKNGNPVKNWKMKFVTWCSKERIPKKAPQGFQ